MAKGIISPLKKGYGDSKTLVGSLLSNGYTRAPGAGLIICPQLEKDKYKTGLDEDAYYISNMSDEEAKTEKARVKAWREKCERYFGVPMGPKDKYYAEMFSGKRDQAYCPYYKMHPKEDMIFDLDNPEELVIYAYMRVHDKYVAPSYDAYHMGKVKDPESVCYYVKDELVEAENTYRKNKEMNKATAALETMSPSKQIIIARCLRLGVSDNSSPEQVYNILNSYIKQGVIEEGYYKGKRALETFNTFVEMQSDNLDIYNKINKALETNVLRTERTGIIKKGDEVVGKDLDEAVEYLLSEKGQDMLLIISTELDKKKNIPGRSKKEKV